MNTEDYKGFTIEIRQDEVAEDPREWDNLGTMICWHREYRLGDKHDYEEPRDLQASMKAGDIALPLYLYDHSGLRMKVGSFQGLLPEGHAEFDTMCVGWIVCRKETYLKEFNQKRTSLKLRDKVRECLKSEIKTYDMYLMGAVYYFNITDRYGEDIDSLGGIYGYDEALEEAQTAIDSYIQNEQPKARNKSILGRAHV